jgi:TonB family protein
MKKAVSLFIFLFFSNLVFPQYKGSTVQFNVDNWPSVHGGNEEWNRFLKDHLIYPAEELSKKKEGLVQINCIITKAGKAVDCKIAKSADSAIDREALRLLSLIDWIPSYKKNEPVNVSWSVKIKFSVSRYKKWVKERGFDRNPFTDLPMDSSNVIYETADRRPVFDFQDKTLPEFIYSSLQYPEIAARQGFEGKVKTDFVIEPDGRVSNIRILQWIAGGCDIEATRIIGLTRWKPAVYKGKYVRYRMSYAIDFKLNNNFKDNSNNSQRGWGQ